MWHLASPPIAPHRQNSALHRKRKVRGENEYEARQLQIEMESEFRGDYY